MTTPQTHTAGPAHRSVEIGVALLIALFAAIVIFGSVKAGIGWGAEGPRAGFFPFYVGVFILISSAINLWNAVCHEDPAGLFAEWGQLRRVISVIIPTTVYVATMPFIGIYVGSFLLIALFMRWLGKYSWLMIVLVSIGMPLITYIVFEKYFLVPLPKGPLEEFLGL